MSLSIMYVVGALGWVGLGWGGGGGVALPLALRFSNVRCVTGFILKCPTSTFCPRLTLSTAAAAAVAAAAAAAEVALPCFPSLISV